MIFWNSCFFHDPSNVGNLISGSSDFSKSNLNIWKFTVHVLLKPGLKNFEHYFASMEDECNCTVVWTFFLGCLSLGLEWKLTFSSPVATPGLSKLARMLSAVLSQHHLLGFEIIQLEFHDFQKPGDFYNFVWKCREVKYTLNSLGPLIFSFINAAVTHRFSCKTLLVFALLHSAFQGQICLLLHVFLDFILLHSSPL